ncbi:DUF1737 domain-containing protein [Spirosoma validum]|uniref:DUF1737 domain-containing protein n=1 Tax=Spirosoma validum TaxID=2771355 RepID=A0A927GE48_9BACT|nr:DUF1737 domain-containing protein [Spirosoma validum]MBD2754256.1 DUF1737 domain-containing protein [Spirosoma validum]
MRQYEVCEGNTADELERAVRGRLSAGFVLHGSMVVVYDHSTGTLRFFQSLVKL